MTEDVEMLSCIACLYATCIPSFIETIDARVRGSLWACIDDTDLIAELEESVVETEVIEKATDKSAIFERSLRGSKRRSKKSIALRRCSQRLLTSTLRSPTANLFDAGRWGKRRRARKLSRAKTKPAPIVATPHRKSRPARSCHRPYKIRKKNMYERMHQLQRELLLLPSRYRLRDLLEAR